MTSRGAFLSRVRAGLGVNPPPNLAHPPVPPAVDGVPEVLYADPLDDPVAAFVLAAEATGAKVRRLAAPGALDALLSEVVTEISAGRAVVSRDPEAATVPGQLSALGVNMVPMDSAVEAVAACDLGVVGAIWGIAATGTVVVDAGRAGGRSASLLPPTVVVLIEADRILGTAGDLFRRSLGDLPSQLVLISGPSRSGDIEFVLTTGVHGPGSLFVGILETPAPS